jgi:tetratricopeptide (TPR) repeat protein
MGSMGERGTEPSQTPLALGPDRQEERSMTSGERIIRLRRLQDAVTVCPTDLTTRCELASLLEELGRLEEALFNWKAVLACNPNHLNAWEGAARCREELARSCPRTYE